MNRKNRNRLIAAGAMVTGLAAVLLFVFVPPIVQDQSYHVFADGRTILGIHNFWNVTSNIPFALVGALGLWKLRGATARVLFLGVLLTCFGSAYYHLAPSDARLVWDRLPMTVVFMSFLFWVLTEDQQRSDPRLLLLLVACGIASVAWWRTTGDLRPYVLVQFGPMVLLLPALGDKRSGGYLWFVFGFYALAKSAEYWDASIYSVLPVSGHTCKHILAALGSYWMLRGQTDRIGKWHRPKAKWKLSPVEGQPSAFMHTMPAPPTAPNTVYFSTRREP